MNLATVNNMEDCSLDLVISFDDTGSMSSVRRLVKQNIVSLVEKLMNDIPGIRIGAIINNDYCDHPQEIFTMDFSRDVNEIQRFVNQDSPCGGGDAPECYELVLHEARNFSWKSDRRALILIGDEVPHHVGYRYCGYDIDIVNHLDWKEEAKALGELGVEIYGVQALGRQRSSDFYSTISRMTGGVKLDLSQFQHISTYLNAIAYYQSGQLDNYEKSDPTFSTNLSLKNMFNKLRGGEGTLGLFGDASSKIELLSRFQVMTVTKAMKIKDFVEMMGCTFQRGHGYYQLIERTDDGKANFEKIQPNKKVIFVNKETGEAFDDEYWCRNQLRVPYGTKGTVRPLQIPDVMKKYEVYVQSMSYTRNLDCNTKFLYEGEYV